MKKTLLFLLFVCSLCLLSACGGGTTTTPPPPPATHFSVTAPAAATVGTAFNITVTALDASNNTVTTYSGTIHFTSIDNQAVLPANSTLTNGTGTFSATLNTPGSQTITATDTAAAISGTSNSINVTASPATHLFVTAPASTTTGVAFSVTVTALDASNNVVTGYADAVTFTSTDGQAVLPANSTLTNGTGTFSATLKTSGSQTVTATDTVTASITGTSNSITVNSTGGATHFSVTTPTSATAGTAFNITVTALDASNNVASGYSDTLSFTSTDAHADLPANSTLLNGVATFPAAFQTAGSQTITATDTLIASITGTSNAVTVSGASAANPVPFVNQALSPDAVAPGGPSLTLTVNGTGFVSGSVVHWNGSARATNFISNSKLTATVLAADVSNFNTALVTVFSPAPGGGTSNVVFFETTRPTSVVALATPSDFVIGQSPAAVATGDFNGDGKIDLVVANSGSNNVSILLGNGDGTFQTAKDFDVDSSPQFVATGDFNGDGKVDLVVANSGGNNVSVLLGNGDGTFQTAVNYAVASGPQFVATGDFNGDGKLDLVVVNTGGTTVSVLLGNGDGTFQIPLDFSVGAASFSAAVGDFNGDGKLDLAVVNFGGNVNVLLGNGDGTFQPAVTYSPGNVVAVSIVAADFNGDGKLDLAVSNIANAGPGSVSVLIGKGDGTFEPAVVYSAGSNTDSAPVAVGDFNGDGKLDLVVATSGTNLSNNINLLLGNGDGTFQAAVGYGAGSNFSVVPADFNGDGRLDLAVVGPVSSAVSALLQPGLVSGPSAFFSPESLTFATQILGTTSAPQPVLLSNYGTATLTLSSIAATTDFTEVDDCGSSVAAGAGCTINVTLVPSSIGNLSGTLSVTDDAPKSPQAVPLSGSSTEVALTPSSLGFGCFPGPPLLGGLCSCHTSGTATLTNRGNTTLDISNITISGDFFSETNNCPASLGAGQSCSIGITWLQSHAARFSSGTLSVSDNGGASPQTVSLSASKSCTPSTSASSAGLAADAACGGR